MRQFFIILVVLFMLGTYHCQNLMAQSDTTFNQSDTQGHKQGFWKVKFDNGALKYSAFFKDDKPIGLMKRYYEEGALKAVLVFDPSGITRAKLYYEDGPLAAEGNYLNSAKDSTWKYYSYYTKAISNRETYINGKKNGTSVCYFTNGHISEESQWNLDVRNGIWNQYFENHSLKMSTSFVNGKRDGDFILNYPNKLIEWKGFYKNDQREGLWEHFDPTGKKVASTEYRNGEPLNAEALDANEQAFLKSIEDQKGKIPEPDEINFLTKPKN